MSVPFGINERNALNFHLTEADKTTDLQKVLMMKILASRTAERKEKNSKFPELAVFNKSHVGFFLWYHQMKVQIGINMHTHNMQVLKD